MAHGVVLPEQVSPALLLFKDQGCILSGVATKHRITERSELEGTNKDQ